MQYGEKLKSIKKQLGLTNAKIHDMCDVPLSTVTRIFDEDTPSGNFATFVNLARGLNFSLDELAGLKPPTESPNPELLKEKDIKIQQLIDAIQVIREDNKSLRKVKFITIGILVVLVIALLCYIIYDLLNGHLGVIRY